MMNLGWRRTTEILGTAALLALTLVGWIGYERRKVYLMEAEHHLGEMVTFENASRADGHLADMYEGRAPREWCLAFMNPVGDTKPLRASQALKARRAAYHSALIVKYRLAAAFPWLGVAPDPPSP